MKKNLFLAYTPYHVLLLTGKAFKDCRGEENYLFIVSNFGGAEQFKESLEKWPDGPFKAIVILSGEFEERKMKPLAARVEHYWGKRQQGHYLTGFMRDKDIQEVYLCNDLNIQSQYILREVARNPQIGCSFLEDGSYIYQAFVFPRQQLKAVLISKLIFGLWWTDKTVLGLNENIDYLYAAFPEIVRPELRQLNIKKLDPEVLLSLRNTKFLKSYFSSFSLPEPVNTDILFIIPHSEFFNRHPAYQGFMQEFVSFVAREDVRVGLKYHPREPKDNYLGLNSMKNCSILPKELPIEVYYLQSSNSTKVIMGDVSTALFTAKWMFPSMNVISLSRIIECTDAHFIRSGQSIGLDVPENKSQLDQILQKRLIDLGKA